MASFFLVLFPYIIISLICSTLVVPSQSRFINHNTNARFSLSLIHRDSPQSPFYNHSMTTNDRHAAAALRTMNRYRYHHLTSSNPDISFNVTPDGEFVATIGIGTPQTDVTILVDTGSALNWVKAAPIFDATKSSSYRKAPCSENCVFGSYCNKDSGFCEFNQPYADGSTASGVMSHDNFVVDDPTGASKVTVQNLQFGYATKASSFSSPNNGILGLSMEPESFISQLGITRFSHCFHAFETGTPSRMHFGPSATMGSFATAILPTKKNYYYVALNSIAIGEKIVDMPPGVFKLNNDGSGGFVVDTGTSLTRLRREAYEPFKNEMKQRLKRSFVDPVQIFDLCFSGNKLNMDDLPDVTFRFENVGVQLIKDAVYVEAAEGVLCVGILPFTLDLSVFGNYQMRNLLVGYDLEKMQISFGNVTDCSAF